MDDIKDIRSVADSMGVDAPILRIIIINPIKMTELYKTYNDVSEELLKSIRTDYSLLTLNNEDDFSVMMIYDILYRDINDPNANNTMYYIKMKRDLQTMEKCRPDIINTFFYKDEDIDELEQKICRGIRLAFKLALNQFKKDVIMISYNYDRNSKNITELSVSPTYMQRVVNKVIHEKFCVINEIWDNESSNIYVVIKEKEI